MPQLSQSTYNLASCYENALTIILRLSTMQPQASGDSQDFRVSIRAALKAAMEQAKTLGYSSEINQLAFFAVVGFLDESVLKAQNPSFADWAQRPLQEEMFGHNRAGEVFFDHLHTLLNRQDSRETADCLEVYSLCMLLGFRGRYALSGGEINVLIRQAREKIDRIRGQHGFMPRAEAPDIKAIATVDRWSRGLGIAAIVLVVLTVLAFGGFWFILNSGASRISYSGSTVIGVVSPELQKVAFS